jgi:hypothetical protein
MPGGAARADEPGGGAGVGGIVGWVQAPFAALTLVIAGSGAVIRPLSLFGPLMVGYGAMTATAGVDALTAPKPTLRSRARQWLLRGMNFWATR